MPDNNNHSRVTELGLDRGPKLAITSRVSDGPLGSQQLRLDMLSQRRHYCVSHVSMCMQVAVTRLLQCSRPATQMRMWSDPDRVLEAVSSQLKRTCGACC